VFGWGDAGMLRTRAAALSASDANLCAAHANHAVAHANRISVGELERSCGPAKAPC